MLDKRQALAVLGAQWIAGVEDLCRRAGADQPRQPTADPRTAATTGCGISRSPARSSRRRAFLRRPREPDLFRRCRGLHRASTLRVRTVRALALSGRSNRMTPTPSSRSSTLSPSKPPGANLRELDPPLVTANERPPYPSVSWRTDDDGTHTVDFRCGRDAGRRALVARPLMLAWAVSLCGRRIPSVT